jgi:hypothetical protein
MRIATSLCCIVSLAAFANAQTSSAELPQPADYAWGFPVQLKGDASFYSIQLPLEVNQSASDPLLRDAGVYNGEGRPVPRVFAAARPGFEETELRIALPIMPLFARGLSDNDLVDLLLEQNGDTTTLQFHTGGTANRPVRDDLSAYIVDARDLEAPIDAFDFDWTTPGGGFIGQVMVDASNDLRDWTRAGSAAIAELREDSAEIIQRRVMLEHSGQDFLRIRWEGMPDAWALNGISAVSRKTTTGIVRESLRLNPSSVDAEDGGRIFEIGGTPLVDRVQLLLSEQNVVVTATIFYWSEPAGRWTRIVDGNFHHVGRGNNAVVNEPVAIRPLRTSRLKVLITKGQIDAPLKLELGWRPDTLLFLAQGSAPYTLVAGRAEDSHQGFPQQMIYGVDSISELAARKGNAGIATLGPRYPLGGTEKLSVTIPRNWSRILLWLGLALGVLFVGYMAYRIVRDPKMHGH